MRTPTKSMLSLAITAAISLPSISYADEMASNNVAQELEIIVVSGTKTEKPLKDVAGSISVVTSEEIEKQVVSDMNQLFKYDPSVQVTGTAGGAQNIVVRGMGSDRILMIKDGMRMNEGYGANGLNDIVGRGFIDTDTLKQVEVAKGAASSLYGSDALGGMVVFTTKDASDYLQDGETIASTIKAGYANNTNQTNLSSTLALKSGDFEHLINVGLRDGEEEQNYYGSEAPFTIESHSVLYKAKYALDDEQALHFSADLWEQTTKGDSADGLLAYFRGLEEYGYNVETENSTSEKSTDSFKLSYNSDRELAFADIINVSVYHTKSTQDDEEYAFLDINAPMFGVVEQRQMWKTGIYQQTTNGLLSNASKKLNNMHTIGYGVDIESTNSKRTVHEYREVEGAPTKDVITNKFPENDTFRAGLFINDEIKLLDGSLVVTPGVRFDKYEMDPNGALKETGEEFAIIDETNASFNFGALYYLSDTLSAFFQYGQGFKVPAYDLAYIEHSLQPASEYKYNIIPADDLSPEKSDSYEIGLRGHFGNLAFTSAIFHNKYDDFLSTELLKRDMVMNDDGSFSHIEDTFQYQNIESVTIKGAELGLTYYIGDNYALFANAAYQDGKNDLTDEYISSISPLSGNIGVNFEFDKVSSDVIVNWAKRMTKVNEGKAEVAGYGTLDWQVNYQLNERLTANFAVNNLFGKEYVKYNNVAGHSDGANMSQMTEPGRHLAMSVRYQF